jgi:hypothetical protein
VIPEAYRQTPYGWEPEGIWDKPPEVIPPDPVTILLRLIDETVAEGVPPERAVKWWLHALCYP